MKDDPNNITNVTPWIEEMLDIITCADIRCDTNINVAEKIRTHGGAQWIWEEFNILDLDETTLLTTKEDTRVGIRHRETLREEAEERLGDLLRCTHYDKGKQCEYTGSAQQVAVHMSRAHKITNTMNKYIICNSCPLCGVNLACQRTVRQHRENTKRRFETKHLRGCATKNINKHDEHEVSWKAKHYSCDTCN